MPKAVFISVKVIGYTWICAAAILVIAGLAGIFMKDGFYGLMKILNPFNFTGYLVAILTFLPGILAIQWAEKRT